MLSSLNKQRGYGSRRAALLAASLLASAAGSTALAQPAPAPAAAVGFALGDLKVTSLRDAENTIVNDGKVLGAKVGPAAVANVLADAGAPTDKVTLDVDALLVRGGGRIMLFDTGLGPAVHGALLASLARAGVSPDQVTDVFITHSHFDHIGGLATASGAAAFPNAIVHISAPEWVWMKTQPQNAAIVHAVDSKVTTFTPGAELVPGVRSVALPGHTPGHVGYEIRSHGQHLLDIGDVAHSTIISLRKPDWAIGYDGDEALGAETRRAALTRIAANGDWVFAPHFPFPGVGKIVVAGDGFRWKRMLP